jgi:hypothetical protein
VAEFEFDKVDQRVAFIMDHIPQARHDYLTLILGYWKIFDGVNIPDEIFAEIVEKGSQPETISRSRRKVKEQLRMKQYLELQRMVQVEAKVKAPLIKGGQLVDRREENEST